MIERKTVSNGGRLGKQKNGMDAQSVIAAI
jgi:hypothetical protein